MKSPRTVAGLCAGATLLICLGVEYALLAAHPAPTTLIPGLLDQIHKAVFDFLPLHLGAIPLFICNAPDIAISLGVVLLLGDAMFKPQRV